MHAYTHMHTHTHTHAHTHTHTHTLTHTPIFQMKTAGIIYNASEKALHLKLITVQQ